MADDRIDIEIADKVDASIDGKIAAIGTAAKSAHSSVKELQSELARIKGNSIAELSRALRDNATATIAKARADSMAAAATDKAAAAYLKSERALNQAVAAETRARTEAQRLATATEQTAIAATKAETATLALAAAQERQAAAQARAASAQGRPELRTLQSSIDGANGIGRGPATDRGAGFSALAAQAQREEAAAMSDLAARAATLKAAVDPLWAAEQRLAAEVREASTLLKAGAIDLRTYEGAVDGARARFQAGTGAVETHNASLRKVNATTGLASYQQANLVAQLNDVFVSLASGQKPLTVFIQQGSQLSQLAGSVDGGWKKLIASTLRLTAVFLPFIIAAGLIFGVLKSLNTEFNKDAGLKKYADGLGLTDKEMKKLGSTTITAGDQFKGFLRTVMDVYKLKGPIADTTNFFGRAWDATMKFMRLAFVGFYGLVVGGLRSVMAGLEGVRTGLNGSPLEGAKQIADAFGNIGSNVTTAVREADATLTGFVGKWKDNSANVAKEGLDKKAAELIADRTPKRTPKGREDNTAENRAGALAKINRELDSEIRLMNVVGPQREAEAKFDEINNNLLSKKITLNAAETATLKEKIATIVALKPVQAEMDRIYEEFQAPQRTYNASLEASNSLLAQGKISLAEYARAVNMAENALEDATDPLAAINRDLANQLALTSKFGAAQGRAQFLQGLAETYRTSGRGSIYQENDNSDPNGDIVVGGNRALKPEIQEAADANDRLSNAQYVHDELQNLLADDEGNQKFLSNYKAMLTEVEALRKEGVVSEGAAFRIRGEMAEKYVHARLTNEENVLSQLMELQNSSVAEIAAIGKAAAITQATIDGYAAVQKALASAPPPFNFALAAVVGAAAAANVAKIAGFESGGYTGNGGRSEVAGVVHGREFVVNATGTARNRELLEMMNRGANLSAYRGYETGGFVDPSGGTMQAAPSVNVGSPNVNVTGGAQNVKVVNVSDPSEIPSAMETEEGERAIFNVLSRNKRRLQSLAGA